MNTAIGLLPVGNDKQLLQRVFNGNFDGVKALLEAGASVNGPPEQSFSPIVAATIAKHAGMVDFLLERGADPDRPVNLDLPSACPGERVLHIAARSGKVEIVRVLLNRSHADVNATDNAGRTPLLATCSTLQVCVEVVRLLLEAGADPALAAQAGQTPLHSVAQNGHMDLVNMLHSRAPATLNRCGAEGQTPLFLACGEGHEGMVSKLLSLGAMQPMPPDHSDMCPLLAAVSDGFVGVLRILINEGGIGAVGGKMPLMKALYLAIRFHQARILRLLLTADGEGRRSEWASINIGERHLLHYGAGYCYPAAVSILLEAGADEAVRDTEGRFPRDAVGVDLNRDDEFQMDRGKDVAVRRMLQRGPAYRARSWAWPSDAEDVGTGSSGDGDTAAAAAAAAAAAVLSSPPAVPKAPVIGMRIFRPKEESSSMLFVRVVGRYCAKD